jgi:hypothetical protein
VVFAHNPYGDHSYWGPQTCKDSKRDSSSKRKETYPFHMPIVSSSHHSPGKFILSLAPERNKPFLPDIRSKPFFDVKSDINFLEKNREAAKLLTKSQSQARIIQSKSISHPRKDYKGTTRTSSQVRSDSRLSDKTKERAD